MTKPELRGARAEIRRGWTGKFRFVIIAENGETIATSETYKTKAMANKGIASLASNGWWRSIVDKT